MRCTCILIELCHMRFIDWETPPPSRPKEAPKRTWEETVQLTSAGWANDIQFIKIQNKHTDPQYTLHKPHGAFQKYYINLSSNQKKNSARDNCVWSGVEYTIYTFVNRNKTYSLGIGQSLFSPNIHFRKLQSFSDISTEGLVFRADEKIPCCLSPTLQIIGDVAFDSRNIGISVIVPKMDVVEWQGWFWAIASVHFFFEVLTWLGIVLGFGIWELERKRKGFW